MKLKVACIGIAMGILILAAMHYAHIWTLLGFKYN